MHFYSVGTYATTIDTDHNAYTYARTYSHCTSEAKESRGFEGLCVSLQSCLDSPLKQQDQFTKLTQILESCAKLTRLCQHAMPAVKGARRGVLNGAEPRYLA